MDIYYKPNNIRLLLNSIYHIFINRFKLHFRIKEDIKFQVQLLQWFQLNYYHQFYLEAKLIKIT